MKKIIFLLIALCFVWSIALAEEPCDEKSSRIKYNQERIEEIGQELAQIRGWADCLANERNKLIQNNQRLRQPEPEKGLD